MSLQRFDSQIDLVCFVLLESINNYIWAGVVADPLGRRRRRWYTGGP